LRRQRCNSSFTLAELIRRRQIIFFDSDIFVLWSAPLLGFIAQCILYRCRLHPAEVVILALALVFAAEWVGMFLAGGTYGE